jgi:hypothetical protein
VTRDPDHLLADRFAALAGATPEADSDWADVLRRARRHRAPVGLRGPLQRRSALLVAAAAAAVLLAVPAFGVGARVADLADEILGAEEDLRRSHPGDVLPRTMFVHETGPDRISGRAPSPAAAAVEIQFADGGSASVEPDEEGIFAYEVPSGRVPELLVARGANGALIESVPLPPPPGAPATPGPLGTPDPARDCPLGKAPTAPSPRIEGEPVRPLTNKLVLACTTTASGQRVELVGYRIGGAREPGRFCIDLVHVPEGLASGCGTARGARGIAVHSFSFGVGLPRRLTGAAAPRSRNVRFHYHHRGTTAWQHTNAIRLHAPTLARLGVERRFTYWIAELPDGARPLRVEARAGGRTLASAPGRPRR